LGPYAAIKAEGAGLGDGVTSSVVCPFCSGGKTKEVSFSLTREGMNLLYLCHRATCGRKGRVWLGEKPPEQAQKPSFTPRIFDSPTRILTDDEMGILWNSYRLGYPDVNRHGLRASISAVARLVVPVRAPDGRVRGFETRWLVPKGGTGHGAKTLHYRHTEDPWQGWFFPRDEREYKVVVMVEDVLSAIKVSRQFPAVSVMGSYVDRPRIMEVIKTSPRACIKLALDKDATGKALEFKEKFRFFVPDLQVVPLDRDMKYMDDDEIRDRVLT
jgi:hypothetical protein